MNLRNQWLALREEQPHLRIRDAAALLGTSELQLLATGCGEDVVRLDASARALLEALPALGPLMALTRNEHAVHEKTGPYQDLQFSGHVALALGEHIDLRMFLNRWKHAFAVTVPSRKGPLDSIQFFDDAGEAIHKVYATEHTDRAAWAALVARARAADQSPEQALPSPAAAPAASGPPDEPRDRDGLLADWAAMKDTHDFFGMLRRNEVSRRGALRAAEGRFTDPLATDVAASLLRSAAEAGLPIMVFVHNPGCVQIHTGPVERIVEMKDWINVMDPGFNLHLRQTGVANAWRVRKPTTDGEVTSVELLDARGELLVQFFGARKPGQPERTDWRALAHALS